MLTDADVLDHADRGDRVERLARDLAVVHDADVDLVGHARRGGALARELRLRLAQRDPGDVHAVLARGVQRERAPAAADVEHPLARLQRELRADEVELGPLRLLQRRRAARPDRARVRHRLVEEQREVLVGEVVVVRDRALVAQDRVALALRAQLHRRHLRHAAQRARLDRGQRDLAAWSRLSIGGGDQLRDQRERRVDVVDVDPAAHVGAAEAELARRAQHVAERLRRGDPERRAAVAVGRRQRRAVPQLERERAVRAAPRASAVRGARRVTSRAWRPGARGRCARRPTPGRSSRAPR